MKSPRIVLSLSWMPASKSSAHTRETSEGDRIAAAGDDGSRHVVVRELAETLL